MSKKLKDKVFKDTDYTDLKPIDLEKKVEGIPEVELTSPQKFLEEGLKKEVKDEKEKIDKLEKIEVEEPKKKRKKRTTKPKVAFAITSKEPIDFLFKIIAKRSGEKWVLSKEELDYMSLSTDLVIEEYLPKIAKKWDKLINLGVCLSMILTPRLMPVFSKEKPNLFSEQEKVNGSKD